MGLETRGKMERCGRQMGREMGHTAKVESRGVGRQLSNLKGGRQERIGRGERGCDESGKYI